MARGTVHRAAHEKIAKGRRQFALNRPELGRVVSAPRVAAGVTSHPIKADDPVIRAMIDEALAKRMLR